MTSTPQKGGEAAGRPSLAHDAEGRTLRTPRWVVGNGPTAWPARGQGDYRVIELLANPDQLGRPSSPRDPANPEWPGRTSVGRWPTTPDSEKNALVMGNRGLTESQVKWWHPNRDMAQDPIAAPRATRETPVSQRGLPEDWSSHRVIELLANPDQPGHEQPAATPSGGLFKAPTRVGGVSNEKNIIEGMVGLYRRSIDLCRPCLDLCPKIVQTLCSTESTLSVAVEVLVQISERTLCSIVTALSVDVEVLVQISERTLCSIVTALSVDVEFLVQMSERKRSPGE